MILMNERVYAEQLYNGEIKIDTDNLSRDINILVRYCYQILGYKKQQIVKYIDKYLYRNLEFYSDSLWYDSILKYIAQAKNKPLTNISEIEITQKEIDIIKALNNINQEKLLFTYLCLAKYNNKLRDINNNWVSTSHKVVKKLANINVNWNKYAKLMYIFKEAGLITLSKSATNECVNFIDNDGESIITITMLDNLGFQYAKSIINDTKIGICTHCGKFFRKSAVNQLICCKCKNKETAILDKIIVCIDCGAEVRVNSKDNQTCRCEECQKEHIRKYDRERKRKTVIIP